MAVLYFQNRQLLSKPQAELQRLNPAELLYSESLVNTDLVQGRKGLRRRSEWEFDLDTAYNLVNKQFGTNDLTGFGVQEQHFGLATASCLFQYVKDSQRTALPHIRNIIGESSARGYFRCGNSP